MPVLTERQQQCLWGVLGHRTAKEIGRELGISHHAVEQHLKAARRKLGTSSTLEAARVFASSDAMVGPYYDLSDVHEYRSQDLATNGRTVRHEVDNPTLHDSAGERSGFVYGFSAVQTLGAILLTGLGLVAILALMIAVAQGVKTLTS